MVEQTEPEEGQEPVAEPTELVETEPSFIEELKKDTSDLFDRATIAGVSGFKALGSTFLRRGAKAISQAVDDFTGKKSKD